MVPYATRSVQTEGSLDWEDDVDGWAAEPLTRMRLIDEVSELRCLIRIEQYLPPVASGRVRGTNGDDQ